MATGEESEAGGLTRTEIEAIAARLGAGEYLDEHYRAKLFRQPKEAELVYAAKEGRSSVLSRTMAVPLQVLKRFGEADAGSANKLVFGDNLQVLKTLLELKERGELRNADGASGVRLCYIDPPFATKREFRTSKGQLAYRDKVEGAEFVEFLRKRLIFIHELLADDGVLYLHLDTNKVHYMKVLLDEIFGPQNFRTEIIWKRSSAHSDTKQGRAQHGRIHDTILFYSKGQSWRWNPMFTAYDQSYVDGFYRHVEEGTGRRYRLGDLTAPGGASKGNPRYAVMGVTRFWRYSRDEMTRLIDEGRVVQSSPRAVPAYKRYLDEMVGVPLGAQSIERQGYPTQKPLALLERIIESSSNEGDLVLDCFAGSGSTVVAAEKLGRRWIGVDCGKLATYVTQRRLLALTEKNGKQPALEQLAPFEVCSAGLYDNELLEQLPYERYEEFCLQLFGCRRQPHEISGVRFAATRKGAPVHCFPFRETDAQMGRTYIESLHDRIGSKVTGPVYVIAPVSACDPGLFEDVITLGQSAYFVLRVPYSVIEALHGRDFELPLQPDSMAQLNDALDSFGFDFLEVPEVEASYERAGDVLRVVVDGFRRGGLDPDDFDELEEAGRADLAMVLIDSHYDAETFNLTESRFGAELRDAGWAFDIALDEPSARVCLIYMDIHGNELREVIDAGKGSGTHEPSAGVGLAAPGRREVEA